MSLKMVRLPTISYVFSHWRRYPATALCHIMITLALVTVIVALAISTVIIADVDHGRDTRDLDRTDERASSLIQPPGPLNRVADDSLEEWISELLSGKVAAMREEFAAMGPVATEGDAPAKKPTVYVEVLGESEAVRLVPRAPDNAREPRPAPKQFLPGDLPVPRSLLRQRKDAAKTNSLEDPSLINPFQVTPKYSDIEQVRGKVQNRLSTPTVNVVKDVARRRSNVLIVAAMRTGSSFVGELFRQRKDFFYMFEPGMILMNKLQSLGLTRGVLITKLVEMFGNIYRCRFDNMQFFFDALNEKTLHSRQQAVPAIVSSMFCRRAERHARGHPKDICEPVTEMLMEIACSSRANGTAIKTIRILDINLLVAAVQNADLKVIHLVRDPRSMIVSRLRIMHPGVSVFNQTHLTSTCRNILVKYCSNWLQNYEVGQYVPLFRKNYFLLRYEDLALDPYAWASKIYDFVGVGTEIPSTVRTWLDANTNVDDTSKRKAVAFSTKRDSKSVLVGWKPRVTLDLVNAIERIGDCTQLMEVMGYRMLDGNNTALTDLDDHLVGTLPRPAFNVADFQFL